MNELIKCEECKKQIKKNSSETCLICGKVLCNDCQISKMCNSHLNQFSQQEKQTLVRIDKKLKIRQNLYYFSIIPIIILGVLLIIVLIPILNKTTPINHRSFVVFFLFFLMGFLVVLGDKFDGRDKTKIYQILKNHSIKILISYKEKLRCDICGNPAPIMEGIRFPHPFKCKICKKDLCPNCYKSYFCIHHLEKVSKEDITKITRLNNLNKKFEDLFIFLIIILFVLNTFQLIFISDFETAMLIMFIIIVFPMLAYIIFFPIVFTIIEKKEKKILAKYNQ